MKKTMYVLGSVELLCGLMLLAAFSILKASFLLLGRVAYQAAAAGSYTPANYDFSCPAASAIAVLLALGGAVQLALAFLQKEKV